MTETPRDEMIAKKLPWIAVVVLVLGVTIVRIRFGWPAVLLWLAFCALSGAILLFWESLRSALDPESHGDDNDLDHRALAQAELEERKRAALRALRDVKQEHELGKLSDEDARELEARYRGEARRVMQELDELLGEHLARAEAEFDKLAGEILESSKGDAAASDESPEKSKADEEPSKPEPVRAESDARDAAEKEATVDRVDCPSCKPPNDRDARFCKSCGTRFESASP